MATEGPNDITTKPFSTVESDDSAFNTLASDTCLLFGDSAFLPSSPFLHDSPTNTTALLFTHSNFLESMPEKQLINTTQHTSATLNQATIDNIDNDEFSEYSDDSDADSDSEAIDCSYDIVKMNNIKNKILCAKKDILECQIQHDAANSIEKPIERRKEKNRLAAMISRKKNLIFSLRQELKIMQLAKENIELRERVAKLEQTLAISHPSMASQTLLLPQYQMYQSPQTDGNPPLVLHSEKKRARTYSAKV